jgi:hypothetical protein
MKVAADLIVSDDLGSALANPTAACAHNHFAKFGCYVAPADRV